MNKGEKGRMNAFWIIKSTQLKGGTWILGNIHVFLSVKMLLKTAECWKMYKEQETFIGSWNLLKDWKDYATERTMDVLYHFCWNFCNQRFKMLISKNMAVRNIQEKTYVFEDSILLRWTNFCNATQHIMSFVDKRWFGCTA